MRQSRAHRWKTKLQWLSLTRSHKRPSKDVAAEAGWEPSIGDLESLTGGILLPCVGTASHGRVLSRGGGVARSLLLCPLSMCAYPVDHKRQGPRPLLPLDPRTNKRILQGGVSAGAE